MQKSVFEISKMDCPSEEQLIRIKLEGHHQVRQLEFDIPSRRLLIYHEEDIEAIASSLESLGLGSKLLSTDIADEDLHYTGERKERRMLWTVLWINAGFFILEILTGFISGSMGLVADSLDMLADAGVYGLSLMVVGAHLNRKKKVALTSGYLQLILAMLGLAEVIRRFLGFDHPPDATTMIIISFLALAGNAICLFILQKSRSDEVHIKASVIFTSNDVIINLGVIIAGILVYATASNKPDLIIGSIVFLIVTRGAFRIMKLSR